MLRHLVLSSGHRKSRMLGERLDVAGHIPRGGAALDTLPNWDGRSGMGRQTLLRAGRTVLITGERNPTKICGESA